MSTQAATVGGAMSDPAPHADAAAGTEIACRVLRAVALQFQDTFGPERLRAEYARLGLPLSLEQAIDPTNYVSFDFLVRFVDALTEASGDPLLPKKAGHLTASPRALGFMYHLLRAVGTPKLAYEKTIQLSPTYNRVGTFTIEKLTDRSLVLRYESSRPEPNRRICELRMGQFASVPTVWDLPEAAIVEHECQVLGAPHCRYELSWQPRMTPVRSALGGGLSGLVTGWALLSGTMGSLESSVFGLMVGGSLAVALGYRSHAKFQQQLLQTQGEGLALSLTDLQQRFDEIQQLNATLEQKVDERTVQLTETTVKLQEALARQLEVDRLKTHFFQNVSHELRTPLTLLLAPLESLIVEGQMPDAERLQLETMRRSALRLLSLINSLLDLSRLDAEKLRLSLEDVDPAQVLRSLVDSAQGLARERRIELRYEGPDEFGEVALDTDKFEKVVLNLLSNALKFTADTGREPRVVVSLGRDDLERLVVSVQDNGIGIPEEDLTRIFERFHQVDTSEQRRYGGTGIGLALVRELAEFHMGAVELQSVEGEGSTFTVRLPTRRDAYPESRLDRRRVREKVAVDRRADNERRKLAELISNPADLALADLRTAPQQQPVAVTAPDPDRPRIVIADDHPDMLAYLATILRRDYEVLTARDGEEALRLTREKLPQLVVSDVMMPRRDGHSLVAELKSSPHTRSIPVILVTAKADVTQKVAGLEHGADDYLTKPFNFLELRARIRQLLRTRALERSLAEKNAYLEKVNFDLVLSKKETFLQTIEALAFAIEAKDPYTHGHSRRVSLLATELGRQLSLGEADLERVRISAVLHDIGKIGIPEHILRKEGRLRPDEEAIIRRHPEIGFRILESVKDLASVNRCVLLHHERFDGGGYPESLRGTDIPLESRIIAVTDTYDAMTTDRPYRRGLSHERAIRELREHAGTQFDPDCVKGFLALYEAKAPVFPVFPSVFDGLPLM